MLVEESLELIDKKIDDKLEMLSCILKDTKKNIIRTGILTNIALETLPNYKNYDDLISGRSQARFMKGVNSKRNYIENQVKKIFSTYELEDINSEIVEKAMELMIITFDSVFINSGSAVKKRYREALEDKEFLYINLRLAVKIITEGLKAKDMKISNSTLNYITEGIKKEKKNIATDYINAYLSGNEIEIKQAKINYRERMEKMLNNYISTLKISYEDSCKIGKERLIVETIGKENLEIITAVLLEEVKNNIYLDNRFQMKLSM